MARRVKGLNKDGQDVQDKGFPILPILYIPVLLFLLCLPVSAEDSIKLSADVTRWYSSDKVTATGNVQATYRDYTITADSAEADLNTNIAVFHGKIRLSTKENTVEGEDLTLNLKTKDWSLNNANSAVNIQPLQGGSGYQTGMGIQTSQTSGTETPKNTGIAYVHSSHLSGNEKDFKLETGSLTTCDLDHPHYFFSADEMEIYPNSRIIAHGVSMTGLGKRLFSLNSLIIPIKGLNRNIFPQIGRAHV